MNEAMGTDTAPETVRRGVQATGTRAALIAAAERLFAERGVHAVSNRQISEAAGQGNNTAVSYHFGSKDQLVRAIVEQHARSIDDIRARLVGEISDPSDLHEWVGVAVRSVIEHLAGLGTPSWYARFLAQVAADPTFHGLDRDGPEMRSESLTSLRAGMNACLPDLPDEVRAARGTMTRHLINQAAADHERQLADSEGRPGPSWDDVADDLVEAVMGVWTAPVGAARDDARGGHPLPPTRTPRPSMPLDTEMVAFARRMREDFSRFMMEYRFAIKEIETKVTILKEEFLHLHRYNPIEHISSRTKTPESTLEKLVRKGCPPTFPQIREQITDIAGVRITCSFIADTYRVLDALTAQDDVRVVSVKDYIANPKPNGYRSLHALIEIPVFLSTGPVPVPVEVQVRTIAMDFWASLEHKIFYKYDGAVPDRLADELSAGAEAASTLDRRMERLYDEVHGAASDAERERPNADLDEDLIRRLWQLANARGGADPTD